MVEPVVSINYGGWVYFLFKISFIIKGFGVQQLDNILGVLCMGQSNSLMG